jgi:hypothetical protein
MAGSESIPRPEGTAVSRPKPYSDELSARFTAARLAGVVGPIVAVCGNDRGDTGPPADLLISHDVVNRNALQNRVDRFRFAGHFRTNPANLHEPEGLFRSRFTSREVDNRSAGQKKDFAVPVFPRPISLGFDAPRCAKWSQERLQARRNEVSSGGFGPLPVGRQPHPDGVSDRFRRRSARFRGPGGWESDRPTSVNASRSRNALGASRVRRLGVPSVPSLPPEPPHANSS